MPYREENLQKRLHQLIGYFKTEKSFFWGRHPNIDGWLKLK